MVAAPPSLRIPVGIGVVLLARLPHVGLGLSRLPHVGLVYLVKGRLNYSRNPAQSNVSNHSFAQDDNLAT